MTKDELVQIIENMAKRIRGAYDSYLLFKKLNKSVCTYREELNVSPAFFTITIHALHHTFVVELAKIFNGNKDDSLMKILNVCQANSKLFPNEKWTEYRDDNDNIYKDNTKKINIYNEIENFKAEIQKRNDIVLNVKRQRDKYFVHLDKEYQMNDEKLKEIFNVNYNEFDDLFDLATNINNKLLDYLANTVYYCSAVNVNDIDNVLNILRSNKVKCK